MLLHVELIAVLNDGTVSSRSEPALDLTPVQWNIAKELVSLLKPVEQIPSFWSGESYVTISTVHPLAESLKEKMKSAPGDSHAIRKVKKAFTAELTNRFQLDPAGLAVRASLVDPRFRKLTFFSGA